MVQVSHKPPKKQAAKAAKARRKAKHDAAFLNSKRGQRIIAIRKQITEQLKPPS